MSDPHTTQEYRRQEAALLLCVGLRTLDRYRTEGRITPTLRREGNGKPVAFFRETDLLRLKEVLKQEASIQELRRQKTREARQERSRRQVRFRLSPTHQEALLKEANEQGIGANDLARALVRDGLESELRSKLKAMTQQVERQEKRIQTLSFEGTKTRQDLKETKTQLALLLTFLTTKATTVSEEKAKAWVEKHLFAGGPKEKEGG